MRRISRLRKLILHPSADWAPDHGSVEVPVVVSIPLPSQNSNSPAAQPTIKGTQYPSTAGIPPQNASDSVLFKFGKFVHDILYLIFESVLDAEIHC